MKTSGKRFALHHLTCGLAVLFLSVMIGVQAGAFQDDQEGSISYDHSAKNYSGLTGLVAMVCNDAMEQFYDFFDPAPVTIEPFVILGEFAGKNRISLLGATMADQMTAVISNETVAAMPAMAKGQHEQRVQGILQEVDGYLRLHISGINTRGERRSYVVNVEMSEPIYRALHSYVFRQ